MANPLFFLIKGDKVKDEAYYLFSQLALKVSFVGRQRKLIVSNFLIP